MGCCLESAAILSVYTGALLVRREIWTQSQGVNDSAMFLPLVGPVNAVFFSESGWLTFLIFVIPVAQTLHWKSVTADVR
jgi:hypothetical protein